MTGLDLTDPVSLTEQLVDVSSVSGDEAALAERVSEALQHSGLRLDRDGDTLVFRTELGRQRRVLLAGHLDTVPIADNVPSHRSGGRIEGCGTSDMKSGLAVLLHLAATVAEPTVDLTVVAYDNEEVEAARNGLGRVARTHPDWLAADLAILMGTHGRGRRGRLPGHAARARRCPRAPSTQCAFLARRRRHPPPSPVRSRRSAPTRRGR